jgi:hypothetical protein
MSSPFTHVSATTTTTLSLSGIAGLAANGNDERERKMASVNPPSNLTAGWMAGY